MPDEEQKRRLKPILLILILLVVFLAFNYVKLRNKFDTVVNQTVEKLPKKDENLNSGKNSNKVPGKMKITSTAFENNGKIPEKYTCKGVNVNPPLSFAEVPEETGSLVLIVDDPDAPAGSPPVERTVTTRTRPVPKPATGGAVYHVYPRDYTGAKLEPNFNSLMAAYNTGANGADLRALRSRCTPGSSSTTPRPTTQP